MRGKCEAGPLKDKPQNAATIPPPLTDQYYAARKQLGLFSGLLIVWELVGISIPEAPLENVKVTLRTPSAARIVLIALVVYFTVRLLIEWFQCNLHRRLSPVSRIDVFFALGISVTALGVTAVQELLDIQLVKTGLEFNLAFILLGAGLGLMTIYIEFVARRYLLRTETEKRPSLVWFGAGVLSLAFGLGKIITDDLTPTVPDKWWGALCCALCFLHREAIGVVTWLFDLFLFKAREFLIFEWVTDSPSPE